MKRIAITGASGFIGRRALERLGESYEVLPVGRKDLPQIEKVLQGVDGVLHCAGKAGAWGSDQEYYEANVHLTRNLLVAAKKASVRRFINLSSPSIYFDYKNQFGLTEDYVPARFSNAYAKTKYEAELEVAAAHGPTFETLSLRPRGVIGAGDTNWFPRIIDLRKKGALKQVGPGDAVANFTSVSNLLDAIALAFSAPSTAMGETYNIHNGTDERFWDVIEAGLKECGLDAQRRSVPLPIAMGLARLNETWHRAIGTQQEPNLLPVKLGVSVYSLTMDISKARNRLRYEPKQSTKEALREFADWASKKT